MILSYLCTRLHGYSLCQMKLRFGVNDLQDLLPEEVLPEQFVADVKAIDYSSVQNCSSLWSFLQLVSSWQKQNIETKLESRLPLPIELVYVVLGSCRAPLK